MENYAKLRHLPLGAITAEGFLKEQLTRSRDGMGGHLYRLEPGMINDPFLHKTYVPAWGDGDQSGWGAEISGNYWTGYIQTAFTLKDPGMLETAERWVNGVLRNRREDGYLGTYYEPDAKIYEDYNAWGTACMLRGLLAYHEATGRADVLDAVHGCLLWFTRAWSGEHKTSYAGPYIIEPMVMAYFVTGDERLRAFAEEYTEWLTEHDIFGKSYKAMEGDFHYTADHTAGVGTSVRLPALVYAANGNRRLLDATEHRLRQVWAHATQENGSPVSMVEYLGPVGSTTETEYCSYAFFNQTYAWMAAITGKSVYGDRMEEMFYNGAQGARKKDEKAIAYLNSPNQLYANDQSTVGGNAPDMQIYAPCYPVSCCPVNAVSLLPEFVRALFLSGDDGLYANAYGPCRLEKDGVVLDEETLYPFRDTVTFTNRGPAPARLHLRVPGWAVGMTLAVNGEPIPLPPAEDGFTEAIPLAPGDALTVRFAMDITVVKVHDEDYANKRPLCVRRGPLVYAYPVPTRWREVPGRPMTPLPQGWSWYAADPAFEEADDPDPHNQIGLRRGQYTWTLALDPALSPEDITVEEREGTGYVWEDAPIVLKTRAWRAPYLVAMYPTRTFEPFGDTQPVTDEVDLTLVPCGCTNLRITYFPRADLSRRG